MIIDKQSQGKPQFRDCSVINELPEYVGVMRSKLKLQNGPEYYLSGWW